MVFADFQIVCRRAPLSLTVPMLAAVCLGGCVPTEPLPPARRTPLPVRVIYPVVTDRLRTTEVCYGKLMARQSVPLTFTRAGIVRRAVSSFASPSGGSNTSAAKVQRGQILAELETPQLDQQQKALQTALTEAENRVRGTAGPSADAAAASRRAQQLQQQLAQLKAEYASYAIAAPFDGVVIRSRIQPGDAVTPGTTALQLAAADPLVVVASLPAGLAARVQPGQPIWVQMGAQTIICAVESIAPASSELPHPGRELVVTFPEEASDHLKRIGDVVEMRFFTEQAATGCWLPLAALQRTGPGWSVFVVDDNRVRRAEVSVRTFSEEFVFVATDLSGVAVMASGGHRVAVGQAVEIVDVSGEYRVPFTQGAAE